MRKIDRVKRRRWSADR